MAARRWTSARVVKIWLDVILALGGVAFAGLLLFLLLSPLLRQSAIEETEVTVAVALGPHSLFPRLPLEIGPAAPGDPVEYQRATLVKGYGEVRTVTNDWGLFGASMAVYVIAIIVVLYAVWILRELVKSVLAGTPFEPANSRRLRRLGVIILALAIAGPFAEYLLGQALLGRLLVVGLSLSPAFRFSTDIVLLGLVFLVLAAVFRHGTELEKERSLTV